MRTWLKILLLFLLISALGYGVFRLTRPRVDVVAVERGAAVHAVPGNVTVTAAFTMRLKSEIGGRVAEDFMDPGQVVQVGDVLLQLETGDLELEIDRIENDYQAVRQRLEVGSPLEFEREAAEEALERLQRQAERGEVSEAEVARQKRSLRSLEQRMEVERIENEKTLAAYQIMLDQQRRELAKMTIRAPAEGILTEVFTRTGDLIGRGDHLAELISRDRVVEARISEENFAAVELQQMATVRFSGYGDRLFQAEIVKILPTADPQTQRYTVHLELPAEAEELVPGLTGEASIVVGEHPGALLIPRRALVGNQVYVVENGRVEQRQVETGYVSLNLIEVTEGLREGERVAVFPLDRIRPGQRVRAVSQGS